MSVEGYKASVVIREKKSREAAMEEARRFKDCPHLLAYGLSGRKIISVFMAPEELEWWINYSELFPDSDSETILIDEVYYPEEPREIKTSDTPPCGAECTDCPFKKKHGCSGCIATT
ncbi:hypothetical protein GF326_03985 [Candidatus Bathyarchaeota archaeon]|nr:hypothetical protein [Candidatus Bathyarchaeota archaeon]